MDYLEKQNQLLARLRNMDELSRFDYLMHLAASQPEGDDELRRDENLFKACHSNLWIEILDKEGFSRRQRRDGRAGVSGPALVCTLQFDPGGNCGQPAGFLERRLFRRAAGSEDPAGTDCPGAAHTIKGLRQNAGRRVSSSIKFPK